ncbi:aminoglycoside phosphotransferase family protein [Nocardioides sp. T5]|uniref:aminoglycoside phosphotransferase family protein n=1 Tax=Nocardioides sp. T5 TaxID=3400182 RepID=UPI003A866370
MKDLPLPTSLLEARSHADDSWIERLPGLIGTLLAKWGLQAEGEARTGMAAVVLPVRDQQGSPAVLRLQAPSDETSVAVLGLRSWNGDGMVRLADHDESSGAMLLERLDPTRTLKSLTNDDDAATIVAGLLRRLHLALPPPGLPELRDVAADMVIAAPEAESKLEREEERMRMRRWAATLAEIAPDSGRCLLHWDLHYDNVLAADREPWLGIDPVPLVGDPAFDLWPVLDDGLETLPSSQDPVSLVRRRFNLLAEALDLDRFRARTWTSARLLQNALWDIEDGATKLAPSALIVDDALSGSLRTGS